jgi:hypothetical protein
VAKSSFLKTEDDPYIVNSKNVVGSKTQTFEDCGVLLEWVLDDELQRAMIAANINILRREAPYAYFFANGVTLEEWESSWLVQNQPYMRLFHSKQLQQGVCLTDPDLDFDTTTVVTAVLLGDILPLARSMQDSENCLVCLPKPLTLEEIDVIFADDRGTANSLRLLLEDDGFLLSTVDFRLIKVRTSNKRVLEYFIS